MVQVYPNLYVGSIEDARDESKIKEFAYVLSCTHSNPVVIPKVVYGRIAVEDGVPWESDLADRAVNFIEEGLSKGKVLVHSDLGTSRAVAAVVFWMMSKGMSKDEAVARIKAAYPSAAPHPAIFGEIRPPSEEGRLEGEVELSVVVVTWNRLPMVKKCIESVLSTTHVPFELIVVDNGSTDGTEEWLKERLAGENAVVVELGRNYGKGVAANKGFERARGRYICYLDGDIVLPEGWYEEVKSAYEELERPGWVTLPYDNTVLDDKFLEGKVYNMPDVCGGMVFIRKDVLGEVGGFRKDRLYGGIDTEYVVRTREKGLTVGFVKSDRKLVHLGKDDAPSYRAAKLGVLRSAEVPAVVPGPVEIVVVRYNLFDVEQQCIESVLEHTRWPYRLTVVDNYERKERLGVLWNEFIGKSKCGFVCLLNSDCIVTEGWLERLVTTFSFDKRIAVVGPSTNMCATQQRVIQELPLERVHDYAKEIAERFRGQWTTSELSGFCYLLRKDVWKELGGFSPEFRFYGQESEFNWRVRQAGFWTVWRKDVFVWHLGRASVKAAVERGEFDYAAEVKHARETKRRLTGS